MEDLSAYKFTLAPGIMHLTDRLREALNNATALIGPRTDTKTKHLSIPTPMGPNIEGLDATVVLTESLPPSVGVPLGNGGQFLHWREALEGRANVRLKTTDGQTAIMGDRLRYLAGWPDDAAWDLIVRDLCTEVGLTHHSLPDGLRIRDTKTHRFVFNYAPGPMLWNDVTIPPAGVYWESL